MRTDFYGLMATLILIGVVVVSMFTFSDNFLNNNNPNATIYEDPLLASEVNSLKGNLSGYVGTTSNSEAVLSNSSLSQGGIAGQNVLFDSVAGIWKALKSAPVVIYNLSLGLIKRKLFGDSEWAWLVDAFGALVILAILIAIIRLVTTGIGGRQ